MGSPEAVGGDASSGYGHVAGDTGAETELLAGVEPDPLAEDTKEKDAADDAVANLAGLTAGGNADEGKDGPTAIPSVLEPLEVERMMGFLEGVDEGVRKKVCSLSPAVIHVHPSTRADSIPLHTRHSESSTPSTRPSSPPTSLKRPLFSPPLENPRPHPPNWHHPTRDRVPVDHPGRHWQTLTERRFESSMSWRSWQAKRERRMPGWSVKF